MSECFRVNLRQAGVPTRNGLTYPPAELAGVVGHAPVHGELDRPFIGFEYDALDDQAQDEAFKRLFQIDETRVSHQASDFEMDGDTLTCRIKVLDTPQGRILQELVKKCPEEVAFVMRGWCAPGHGGVVRNFRLITVDSIAASKKA